MTEVMLREISSGPALVASQIAACLVHKKNKERGKKKGKGENKKSHTKEQR
jgi:hypothetical protein